MEEVEVEEGSVAAYWKAKAEEYMEEVKRLNRRISVFHALPPSSLIWIYRQAVSPQPL